MEQEDPVQPLRLSKGSNGTAPSPGSPRPSGIPRPLSEISPHERRRNSPSWNQAAKKPATMTDSSPFQSSPLENITSPRLFWQNRSFNSENSFERSGSPSPTRRSSIERLQKASRVKNSNILALEQKQEYDPTRVPEIQRPLSKIQGNAFGGTGVNGFQGRPLFGHGKSQSTTSIPILSPPLAKTPAMPISTSPNRPTTPSKEQGSPLKSSLSSNRFKSSFDPETGTWSDVSGDERRLPEGKSLHRHAKSVTFDQAPPQVNEYEMATPDISSIGSNSREGSYDSTDEDDDDDHYLIHGMDQDDSFDASLEDTDKTPVVGPDDWRHNNHDDPFERSPMPDDLPPIPRPHHQRADSLASNGESRPLPPLPGLDGTSRSLPSPPSASKTEIQGLGNSRMPLEERLKLMMLSDDGKSAAEQQRERRMRRAGARGSQTPDHEAKSPVVQPQEDEEELDTVGELSGLDEYQLPPRISRESILRRVNGNKAFERESDYNFSSPAVGMSPERNIYDPDVPIPSTEDNVSVLGDEPVSVLDDESDVDSNEGSVIIKRDPVDQDADLYSIPDMYQRSETTDDYSSDYDSDSRFDEESQYSEETDLPGNKSQSQEDDQVPTPRATTPVDEPAPLAEDAEKPLPEAPKENRLSRGLETSLLPKSEEPQAVAEPEKASVPEPQPEKRPGTPEQHLRRSLTKPEYDGTGWGEDDEFEESDPGTPESVIHRPMPDSDDEEARASPAIPEQIATIKSASGSKLKTRPSATPADLATMREARRQVSREVPPIPDRHRNRLSVNMDTQLAPPTEDDYMDRHPSFKKRSLTLDLDLGLSLDKDFDRVIEAQKRGYLMRQNTKVITASDKMTEDFRACRSAGNSPTKATRPQSWTVEPWNSQPARKRSFKKKPSNLGSAAGPVPPLPGQESNATAVATAQSGNEEDVGAELSPGDENGERGRLFVKVMGVKDLDLPIPKNERTWFSLTLDNGVHCVTTAWLELARNAPIGQEFELVVPNDLEFQLTLNVKLEKPVEKPAVKALPSPTKLSKSKTSAFSRVFASPKKRKEMELRQKQAEEEERLAAQREAQARQMKSQPTAWDLLSPLAADDGSFARAYVCLKDHESKCFGRPYLVDVAAFNEWAMEDAGFASSVKSKRGNMGPGSVVRRAPYKIGKLELQLLFVPRPKGATDEDMPKSMNSCIREMKAAEERLARCWEGHLSQQGGDCPYWRRRYFKLVGTKLTAYHEATRQPRATINLANAKRLIDDRRTLMEKETLGKGGKRRRSAFAEDEEGYMFVEEGFRIRFNNGELIDFYADTAEDKEGWMKVLGEVVGRESLGDNAVEDVAAVTGGSKMKGKWCELVMKREEQLKRKESAGQGGQGGGGGRRVHSRTKSAYV
ncbi:cell division protein anillin-domain-containing protein [Apiosordaria backusii]|uniref:Cell division protein anillin-domain-containing protein n=1 Tax=Apiosordaria backusii TaxID=314023 RepID=A0AA40EI38_9PEZI|nr:cell division protein anillin-domain-containing protein [Apiosordaria backusii]